MTGVLEQQVLEHQQRLSADRAAAGGLGTTALLRLAGVSCAHWMPGGNPALFERLARHADATARSGERACVLAEELGRTVVPHPELTRPDRAAVLALRRRLHAAGSPTAAECALLEASPAVPAALAARARDLLRDAESAAAESEGLERAVGAEQRRVAAQGWAGVSASPVLRDFLAATAGDVVADIERRLAAGTPWDSKALRERSSYLWRMIGRAAAKTTPRDWLGQLALVPVRTVPDHFGVPAGVGQSATGDARLIAPGTVLGAVAAACGENVHRARARPGAPLGLRAADPATPVALAPLHFTGPPAPAPGGADPGLLRCYVLDPDERGTLREVMMRRTGALDAVLALLRGGPRPLGEVEAALLALVPAAQVRDRDVARDREMLGRFLDHLACRGVLQLSAAPGRRFSAWLPPAEALSAGALPRPDVGGGTDGAGERGTGGWFLDSFRRVDTAIPAAAVERVTRGLEIAARVAALQGQAAQGSPAPGPAPDLDDVVTEDPRLLSEILPDLLLPADRSAAPVPPVRPTPLRRYSGWPPAGRPGSGYARLLEHLEHAARAGADQVDLDDSLLDALGAPPAAQALPAWPLDCLLRPLPGPGPVAVLETASPAGVIDARIIPALRVLYGGHGNAAADAYRSFLAAVEQRAEVRFVEVLVPPVGARAANTVCRPRLTGWWTGDPDPAPYWGADAAGAQYLPLDRITLRRRGTEIIAEADGRRLLPVHHATRVPAPPYDTVLRLLLTAGHPATRSAIRLDGLDAALPGPPRLPRLVADGQLVLAPATWRVPPGQLWEPGDTLLGKAGALATLRRAAGLPRHVFARTVAGGKPRPLDLDSLTTVHLVERLRARQPGADLLIEEMLPGPADLLLRDPLHAGATVAAQLVLRLPHAADPAALADDAAARLRAGPHHVPGPSGTGAANTSESA
jgi:hypothetical protein